MKVTYEVLILSEIIKLLEKLTLSQSKLKEQIMGIKEDIAAFKAEFDGALVEIQADIEALKTAVETSVQTPAEVSAALAEMTTKLEAVRNIYNPTPEIPQEPL